MRFRTRKHLALLVRLAMEPGRRFTRDYLTDLLWPDAAPRLANHSLAQGLSVIKGRIAREAVLIQRASVGLAPGWVDVDAHHLTDTTVEITGPFLDGFEIPAARSFEDWKDECRGRLLPQVRDCLARQMDAARRVGDFPTVERLAERLAEVDPLAEEAARGIMEARYWAGDRTNALKAFARYEARLGEELGAKPGADLTRMASLLREGRRIASPAGVESDTRAKPMRRLFEPETLVGREAEFSALYDAWVDVRHRLPRIVVLTGDPGVGKTTLTNAFVSSCQMDGAVVARAPAYDAERELPFAILGELVRQLAAQRAIGGADPEALSELTRVTVEIHHQYPGVPKPVDWAPDVTPLRLADAFLKTVTAAAEECPVVLVVDDVHAADNASTGILHVVARKLAEARVLMILTGRTSELRLSGAPAALTSDTVIEALRSMDVDALAPDAAARLVERLANGAARPDPPVERILRASSGNPLAIQLLTQEWVQHGPESLLRDLEAVNTQPVPTIGIPRAIGAVFERQIRRLDGPTRAALDLAAVLGRRLTDLALYAAVDLGPGAAAEALSRLKDEGLLREVRGDLEFRNELIRAQAYYAVAGPARQHLHRRVGESLENRQGCRDYAISLEIAWHYLRGGETTRAVSHSVTGAEQAVHNGAPVEAERITKALYADPIGTGANSMVQLLLAKALVNQSKGELALPVLGRLLDCQHLQHRERAEVLHLRAVAEYLRGADGPHYAEYARAALHAAREVGEPDLVARSLFEYARSGVVAGSYRRLHEAIQEIDSALLHPDVRANAMIYLARAYCRFFSCEAFLALGDAEAALRLHQGSPNLVERAFLHNALAVCLRGVCRTNDARREFEQALALSTQVGDDSRASIISSNLAMVDNTRGQFESALAHGRRALAQAKAAVNQPGLTGVYLVLMESNAMLGRVEEAKHLMEAARESLVRAPAMSRLDFYMETAGFALLTGSVRLALHLVEEAEQVVQGQDLVLHDVGMFERLRAFRAAHVSGSDAAWQIVNGAIDRLRNTNPLYYINVLPAKAWLEWREQGRPSAETEEELSRLSEYDLQGKRAIWTAQGFLARQA